MSAATLGARSGSPLSRSLIVSAVLHGSVVLSVLLWEGRPEPIRPPVYKMNLVGAPPGVKNIGVVDSRPETKPVAEAPAPSGIERPPEEKVTPTVTKAPPKPTPAKATPTEVRTAKAGQADGAPKSAATSSPRAGSATGGTGADVVTVKTDGLDFPAPGYLNNIRRQVDIRFRPGNQYANRALLTEVSFLIHRDGRVSDIQIAKTSGEYRFDAEARSAVEAAGNTRAFGPLPDVWKDDVLQVYFNFTPAPI